jgi:hypothetical protein
VRRAGEIPQHHPEAVVERDRDADAIGLRVAAAFADEEPVVEDVVVRERRAFRKAGCPRGVLDVDRLVELTARFALGERRVIASHGAREVIVPCDLLRTRRLGADHDDGAQRRERRANLAHHRQILARLVAIEGDERRDTALPQDVLELREPVGGVDVDEDRPDLRRRVLGEHPLQGVGRPDPHPLTVRDAAGDECPREPVGLLGEFTVGQAAARLDGDDRVVVGEACGDPVEVLADRLADERHGARTVRVADLRHLDHPSSGLVDERCDAAGRFPALGGSGRAGA